MISHKMKRISLHFISVILLGYLISCTRENDNFDKYDRPAWLAGKLYTQVLNEQDLSLFARCLVLTGYDTVINTSGCFTVFAPNDSAMHDFLQKKGYASVEVIPAEVLNRLVKYHIVQNPWSTDQLKSLDVYGWIDSTDISNDEPRGFKRETLLRERNPKYGIVQNIDRRLVITDTLNSPWYRRQYADSRKYAPLFYKRLLEIYKLTSNDFNFYFGRPFDSRSMYYGGAQIVKPDIFAENGFINIIDRVQEPLDNAFQILSRKGGTNSYKKFLDLVNIFPEWQYDVDRTEDQPGFAQGLAVDSLFNITYPQLAFNISNERTKAPAGTTGLPANVTIRYHHGIAAPTDEAIDALVAKYLAIPNGWGTLNNAPLHIKRMIANSHLSVNSIYPSDFSEGFYTGEKDLCVINPGNIVQQEFASNCTFIGLNTAIVPRAFTSLVAPIYLQQGYKTAMYLIEKSGLLPALKKPSNNYSLYIESDESLGKDSSLVFNANSGNFVVWQITKQSKKVLALSTSDLRTLLLNHIGTERPTGQSRKEFIRNLAGNFIIVNNETQEVSGTAPTTKGYQGLEFAQNLPIEINVADPADNGTTYEIQNWFNFSVSSMFEKIASSYPVFHQLIAKAGLQKDQYSYTFFSNNEFYTAFIPSDSALNAYRADTISVANLKKFVLMHFVRGNILFTDGKFSEGFYETLRPDEKSTQYIPVFTKIHIQPGYDAITIVDKDGGNYWVVPESSKTNLITGITINQGQFVYPDIMATGVIHELKTVFRANLIDRQ
jgi:uncharacterized surface protein with fasciclin (FAS1) repeats